jgi:hypothetical protein
VLSRPQSESLAIEEEEAPLQLPELDLELARILDEHSKEEQGEIILPLILTRQQVLKLLLSCMRK